MSHNRYILGSDLATVARKGWISHAILSGLTDILQMNTKHTSVLMLNDVLMIGNDDLQKYLSGKLSRSTTRIVFVVNVGRTKSNEVYISSPGRPGCHWALLYIDLKSNKWYYCDTICWGSPSDLRGVVSPVVTAIHQVLLTVPKPFAGIVESHVETSGSTSSTAHTCSTTCLRNIPVQTCMSVCGAAVAILAAIAAKAPSLWKDVFLKRKGVLPDSLEWLMSPTAHSDFSRITLISWLITGSVDISVIGVPEDHIDHVQMATRGKDQGYVHVEGGKTVEMKDDEGSDVHVEERDAVEMMESDDGSCENVSDGQVEDDGEDDEENSQMKGDGEGSDVHVEERDAVDILESDDGSCENAKDGQVEGDGEGDEENSQMKGDGEGSDVHVEERDAVDILESDDGSCENVKDGQVEGDGEDHEENSQMKGDGEGSDVHVEERDAVEMMESDDGSCENVKDGQVEGDGQDHEENSQMKGDEEGSDVHVEERDAVEMMESDDGSCENVNDGQVEDDGEDDEENSQMKGDGEGSDVHVEERDAVEMMESDDGSYENVNDGQVEGDGEDDEENNQVKGDGEGSDVHVEERDAVDIMESDDGTCGNVNDKQVEDDGEGDEKDGGVHDKGRETDEGNDISPGSGQIDDRYKGFTSGKSESLPEDGNEENNSSSGTDENEDQRLFFVGQTFSDLDKLEKRKTKYEEFNFCELWKRDVRTLEAAARRVPKRVAIAKSSLKYYSLKLVCKFGGEARKRTQRIRNTKTFRQGCPFEVYLILSQDGQHLEVIRVNEAHNHVANKTIYEHLPRQRASRVKRSVDNIAEAIKLQANPKLLQQKVEETTGRKVTLKDISNIKQRSKQDINKNNLEDVIQHLKNQPGSTTEVIIDKDDNFKGIFYQDKYMQNLFEKFRK